MHLTTYLDFLAQLERNLATSCRTVSAGYPDDNDVFYATRRFAELCDARAAALGPVIDRHGAAREAPPDRLHADPISGARSGAIGLLRDLQDLYQLANLADITWTLVGQAAYGAPDVELVATVQRCTPEVVAQLDWLRTRMKSAAPQTLLVAT